MRTRRWAPAANPHFGVAAALPTQFGIPAMTATLRSLRILKNHDGWPIYQT